MGEAATERGPDEGGPDGREPTAVDIQVDLIVAAFGEKGIDVGVARCPDGTLDFLFEEGVILVRDAYLPEVAEFLRRTDTDTAEGSVPSPGSFPG